MFIQMASGLRSRRRLALTLHRNGPTSRSSSIFSTNCERSHRTRTSTVSSGGPGRRTITVWFDPTATGRVLFSAMKTLTVRDYMVSEVETLAPDDSLETAVMLERRFRIRHIPIIEKGELVGMVTDRDLKRALPSPVTGSDQQTFERVVQTTLFRQIMTRSPTTISPAAPLREAVQIMCDKKFGAIPVVEKGKLVGIITEVDMLRAFLSLLDKS